MRIDRFLANMGYGSRKDVKLLIKQGLVTVGGIRADKPESHIDEHSDEVCVNGERVVYVEYVYYMINKPAGVISATSDDDGAACVTDLLDGDDAWIGLFPVGRLDKDATGLIILTNDGVFAHRATSPKKGVEKVYHVGVDMPLSTSDIDAFKRGITLDDGYLCLPAGLEILTDNTALATLTEGKFHQVKRMFSALGKKVTNLKRISFAGISLPEDLSEGAYRPLDGGEMDRIARLVNNDTGK